MKRKSLSKDGALAAFCVGFLGILASYRFGFTLLIFYWTSSKLTKYKSELKRIVEDGYREGGQRNATQVLASTFPAMMMALAYLVWFRVDGPIGRDGIRSALLAGYLGFFAATTGDTWASEIGIVAGLSDGGLKSNPILVLPPFRRVPRGTNGGLSLPGTMGSLAGGLIIGLTYFVFGYVWTPSDLLAHQAMITLGLGILGGGLGSLMDSILGATLQASWYDEEKRRVLSEVSPDVDTSSLRHICGINVLSNEQVNLVSALITAIICGGLTRAL